jgi:hypothetical protein
VTVYGRVWHRRALPLDTRQRSDESFVESEFVLEIGPCGKLWHAILSSRIADILHDAEDNNGVCQ